MFNRRFNLRSNRILKSGATACAVISAMTGLSAGAQNSATNYAPGQSIKFGTPASSGSTPSSSFSGTTYAPPSHFGSKTETVTPDSPYGSATPINAADSSTTTGGDNSGQRGLGSLIRGVKHELRNSGVLNNVGNQFSNGYQSGSGFQNGSSAGSQFGGGAPLNYVRMPDGTYRANGPNVGRNDRYRVQQNSAAEPSGDLTSYVTNNMPVAVGGDVESLIPAELHSKAYGIELHRDAPMNGAEGYPE